MHYLYGVTRKDHYTLDIYHELVEKRIYVEFSSHNSIVFFIKNTFSFLKSYQMYRENVLTITMFGVLKMIEITLVLIVLSSPKVARLNASRCTRRVNRNTEHGSTK